MNHKTLCRPAASSAGGDWSELEWLTQFDPTEPLVQCDGIARFGMKAIDLADSGKTVPPLEWGQFFAAWLIAYTRYACRPPATVIADDFWRLYRALEAHPEWFTAEDADWVREQTPLYILDAAIS